MKGYLSWLEISDDHNGVESAPTDADPQYLSFDDNTIEISWHQTVPLLRHYRRGAPDRYYELPLVEIVPVCDHHDDTLPMGNTRRVARHWRPKRQQLRCG